MKKDHSECALTRRAFLASWGGVGVGSVLLQKPSNIAKEIMGSGNGSPSAKPYGSGYFGEWITDEFGLPAFHYTCDQVSDPKAITPTDPVFRSPTEQTHQVGNDRLVAAVSNYGYVQVRQDEGSPKFLNDYAPERSQFGGGIGYLTDGKMVLSTFYPGNGESFDRIFGVGYLRKKVLGAGYSIDHVIFAPFGDDPVLVSQATVTNRGKSAAELRWVEYWGCQPYQFSYRAHLEAIYRTGVSTPGTPGKVVDLRRRFSDRFAHEFRRLQDGRGLVETKHFQGRTADEERLWQNVQNVTAAQAVYSFSSIPSSVGRASMEDLNPPETFLVSLDGRVQGIATDGKAFFGAGGVANPTGLARPLNGDLAAHGSESALLLERGVRLEPGQSETLHFLYGYLPKGADLGTLTHQYQERVGGLWAQSSNQWRKSSLRFETTSEPWVKRELTWSHYYVRSNLTYDDFFQAHILSQGGFYQYIMGFQGAARDPLQHALPLIFTNPEIVKEVLRYTFEEVRPDGSIPYGIVGHGMKMPASQDDASDLPLWLIWVACEYILATRDTAFLDEEVPTSMVGGPSASRKSVRDLLRLCYRHLVEGVGTGPHKLMRMLMDDTADGLVYSEVPRKWRAEYIRQGESTFNSAMAVYVFDYYSKLLTYTDEDPTFASNVRRAAKEHSQAMRAQWTGRWFPRAWLGPHLGWLGTDNLWLFPQALAIIGGITTPEQSRKLVQTINELLRRPSPIGALAWNWGSGHAPAKAGPGAYSGVWPYRDGFLIWALAKVDGEMAWDEWKKCSLARHAEVYPDVWYGTWSGPDHYDRSTAKYPGRLTPSAAARGTGKYDYSGLDFPVMNMHPHAWPLYSASKLLGIEFTRKGVTIRPLLPLESYRFASSLLGFTKSPRGYGGWYAPGGSAGEGTWALTVELPQKEAKKFTRKRVNGIETPLRLAPDGSIEIKGVSSPGKPLRWSIFA